MEEHFVGNWPRGRQLPWTREPMKSHRSPLQFKHNPSENILRKTPTSALIIVGLSQEVIPGYQVYDSYRAFRPG